MARFMAEDAERLRLRWRSSAIGCLLPLMAGAIALFGLAALSPTYAGELAEGRRGALIGMTKAVSVGGVNLPLAAVALYMAFETFRYAWRWADEDAAWTSPWGLHFHGSLFRRPVPWAELRAVRAATRFRGRATVPVLVVETAAARRIEIGGIALEEAQRFAAAVSARLAAR